MPDILTLAAARRLLAAGDLSPIELLDACAARIAASEPRLKAWINVDLEGAYERARRLDPSRRSTDPLWGIPLAVKDIVDVAGLPTTAASRILAGNVAGSDASVVRLLRDAGGVILGKTNTQEFAYGCVTPPTTNPWDPGRIPGGSSGGSAAAVAAGHCPGAIGTDTAGSIRIPAALCGVVGLKPRPGIVPVEGVIPLAPSFDAVGPIASTVEDVSILWQALSGTVPPAPAGDLRIGVARAGALPELSPGVAATFAQALAALLDAGAVVEEVSCPAPSRFDEFRIPVHMWEALQVHRSRGWWPAHANEYTPDTRRSLENAERMASTEQALDAARAGCARLSAELAAAVDVHGILAMPTVPCEAPTHEEAAEQDPGSARRPVVMKLTRVPAPVNVAGLAALSVPCGITGAGLPVGLQLIAREEAILLAAGRAIEIATGWTPMVAG